MAFIGLNIAKNALLAHRAALSVTAHNIANAETPGYVRQRAVLSPVEGPDGSNSAECGIGIGVAVTAVIRIQSRFLQARLDRALGELGCNRSISQGLDEIQSLFLDLTSEGVSDNLAAFFNAWEDLSVNPESRPLRLAVREKGNTLTDGIRTIYRELQNQRPALDQVLQTTVARVNDIAAEIARINQRIASNAACDDQGSPIGAIPNDLFNRLDVLIEELSTIIGVTSVEQANGTRDVLLGGIHLVQGARARQLNTEPDPANANLSRLVLAGTGQSIEPPGGEIAGILAVRDQYIPGYMAALDTFAATLATEFNAVHALGVGIDGSTGTDFFTATGAADIRVSDAVAASLDAIAASETGAVGDGNHAVTLSRVRDALLLSGGTQTLGDYYASLVGRVGLDGNLAGEAMERQDALASDVRARRDSVSGVSLDEEGINMLRFQEAHNAAARLASAVDEMIRTVLSIAQ